MLLCCAIKGGWQSLLTAGKVAPCWWLPVRFALGQPVFVCSRLERQFLPQRFVFVKSVRETLPEMITKNCLVQICEGQCQILNLSSPPDFFWSLLAHAASDLVVRWPEEKLSAT